MNIPVYWQTYGLQNPNSGVFYYAHQIYESLRLAGVDPIMVGSEDYSAAFENAKVLKARTNPIFNLLPKLSEPYVSQKQLKRTEPQNTRSIFHGLSNFNIPLVSRTTATSYVLTIHDLIPLLLPDMVAKSWAIQARLLIPLAAKRADKIVCVSEWTKKTIVDKIAIDPQKIDVIPISISSKIIEKTEAQSQKISVLMVARDEVYKRLDLACEIAAAGRKNLEMKIVTDTQGRARIQRKFSKLVESGQLLLLSNQSKPDLDKTYRSSDIVINTSLLEGFGIPIADALSCGMPTVVTAGSGSEEFLSKEFSIKMSAEATAVEWVDAIEEAFSYLKSDTWYNRIKQHIAKFDSNKKLGQRYLSLYENLL